MMRLHHLIRYLSAQVWAIEPGFLAAGQRLLRDAILSGRKLDGLTLHAELGVPMPEDRADRAVAAKDARIAVVPIMGVIEDHASSLGTSAREIDALFSAALADKKADAILFDVESPGGVVTGVPELADKIAAARGAKPMLAYNGGMMASAAFWLGAAAGEVMAGPSALTGSIGVFTWHEDWSKHLEQEGITITEIAAGDGKAETMPWHPLTEEAEAHLRAQVEQIDAWFVKSVAASRRETQTAIREQVGRARVHLTAEALTRNLVDRVGNFEEAVARLASKVERSGSRGRRADANRRRLALDAAAEG